MKDYYLQIVAEHKATVVAILTAWGSAILALLEMIPDNSIAKLASIASIFACICLGLYHKHRAAKASAEERKINAETIKQELENEILKIDLETKQREVYKLRRKEDKKIKEQRKEGKPE